MEIPANTEFSLYAFGIAFLVFGMAQTAQSQTLAEVEKDSKKLDDAYNRFTDDVYWIFDQPANGTLSEAVEVYLTMYNKVQTINEVSLKQAEQMLRDFATKYGKYKDGDTYDFSQRFTEIRDADKTISHGGSPQPVPSPAYNELKEAIADYKTKIAEKGDQLAQTASYTLDMLEYREDPAEVASMIRDMNTALNLALKFNPSNQQARALLAKSETIKNQKVKELEEARKSARMPKNHAEFKGDAKAVVAKAVEFINSKNTNPKFKYFTGTVASPWYERVDIFGNTIDYMIHVNIGYQTQGEPENVVHVYRAVLYTCTKKAEASFCNKGVVMGWEFTMLKENLNK